MSGRDELLDRLIPILSHDLRTPLVVIAGYAELVRLGGYPEQWPEAPVRIEEAANRLSRMIDDILAALALESGSIVTDPDPVNLGDAIDEAGRKAESCGERSFGVEGNGSSVVSADPSQLQQILVNLLFTVSATAPRTAPLTVETEERDGVAVVSVSGGPAPDARQDGMGLAVVVARRLAELGGGSLSSGEVAGAPTYTLSLPLA